MAGFVKVKTRRAPSPLMRRTLMSAAMVFFAAGAAQAADTLLRYEQRVQRATEIVSRIKKADSTQTGDFVADVKTLLPRSEQVELGDQTITVDNAWLHILLDSYYRKTASDPPAQLEEARTRLVALREQLLRLENESGGGGNLQERRDALQRILSQPEFKEKKEDYLTTLYKRVRKAVITFLSDIATKLFRLIFGERGESGWLFRGIVILIAGAFVAAAVVMFITRRPVRKKAKAKTQIVLDEEIGPDISAKDLLNDALAAYKAGDFRLGIRRLYIALLYQLGERGIIELDRHATNREYMRRAAAVAPLEAPMRYLTERFDYFWYGKFPAAESDFSEYKATFDQAARVTLSSPGLDSAKSKAGV